MIFEITKIQNSRIVLRACSTFLFFLWITTSFAQEEKKFDAIRVNPFDLPVRFDLRETNCLSPVRTQGTGGCWSSSTMVTIEPWIRRAGLGDYSLSDRNLQLMHGFDNSRNTYGNHYMATAYFSRGGGPVIRSSQFDSIAFRTPQTPFILSDARYLPGDPALIKQTIFDFGPVYSMLYFKRKSVDTTSYLLQPIDNPLEHINHAVALVGWDDTLKAGKEVGAWIAQNSLGEKFGDSGFFYISYENESILKHNAVWPEWDPFDESYTVHYYDTLGSFNTSGFNDSICYGLVKFTAQEDCLLLRLATHIITPGTWVNFTVFSDFSMETGPSDSLGYTGKQQCVFPGYYTLETETEISLKEGQDYYVMAKYNAPYYTEPLPVEDVIEDYAYPHITTGTCWVNPNIKIWPDAWYACGEKSQYEALRFDLCIRAITKSEK